MKKLTGITVAVALLFGTAAVHSTTLSTLTAAPNDGILTNFTGIDWHSNGGAWIQGFDLTGANLAGDTDNFTLTYQGFAASIQTPDPTPNLYVAAPGSATGSYELTVFSVLQETATCLNDGCSTVRLDTNSGTFDIYFDTAPNANQSLGTGFTDGVMIASGVWTSGVSTFLANGGVVVPGALGTGGGFLNGKVNTTNAAYIAPDLIGTTLQASLQFPGQSSPTFTRPQAFNGALTGANSASSFVLQADTSQNFVPEPSILALLGISLLGFGATRRRNK